LVFASGNGEVEQSIILLLSLLSRYHAWCKEFVVHDEAPHGILPVSERNAEKLTQPRMLA
jgi:hypothetical protein